MLSLAAASVTSRATHSILKAVRTSPSFWNTHFPCLLYFVKNPNAFHLKMGIKITCSPFQKRQTCTFNSYCSLKALNSPMKSPWSRKSVEKMLAVDSRVWKLDGGSLEGYHTCYTDQEGQRSHLEIGFHTLVIQIHGSLFLFPLNKVIKSCFFILKIQPHPTW